MFWILGKLGSALKIEMFGRELKDASLLMDSGKAVAAHLAFTLPGWQAGQGQGEKRGTGRNRGTQAGTSWVLEDTHTHTPGKLTPSLPSRRSFRPVGAAEPWQRCTYTFQQDFFPPSPPPSSVGFVPRVPRPPSKLPHAYFHSSISHSPLSRHFVS